MSTDTGLTLLALTLGCGLVAYETRLVATLARMVYDLLRDTPVHHVPRPRTTIASAYTPKKATLPRRSPPPPAPKRRVPPHLGGRQE